MIIKSVCHSFLIYICGIPFFQLGLCFSGIKNWFTNSITTFSFFHHLSPPIDNLQALAIECSFTIISNFPITNSKPSKFCAKIIETCSSCPWKVVKNSSQPTYLNLYAICGYASSNFVPSGSNIIICPLFFSAMMLV